MKTKKLLIYVLAMMLLLSCLTTGCKQQDTTLESILPRANVIKTSVSFLNVSVGENIPQVSYEAVASECGQLCDLLYAAVPVVVEITDSYSPELNASHEIFLTTSGGTMTVYYDDYQNLINVPINRRVDEQSVRVYLSYQTTGLAELLSAWQETLPVSAPTAPAGDANAQIIPPDDTDLRQLIDEALFDQASVEVAVESTGYARQEQGKLFYAYGYHEKPELPQNKVLIVAQPDAAEGMAAEIVSVTRSDYYVLVNVAMTPAVDGAAMENAVLVERADVDVNLPVIFIDENRSILYAQYLDIPGETPVQIETVEPMEGMDETMGIEEDIGEPAEPAESTSDPVEIERT